jgi:ABC-type Fe3+-hydroxamate transport system substrate-binding protein
MKRLARIMILAAMVGGCASYAAAPGASENTTAYRGEVWTWDEAAQTVTLRQGTQTIRVKVSPEQIATLNLHETTTVRGQLVGPADIPVFVTPAVPMTAVPRGSAERTEVVGTVGRMDPNGIVSVDSSRGTLKVWTATADQSRFQSGMPVRVGMTVQAVDMVPQGRATSPADGSDVAASVPTEPGDYATITGRIISVEPTGAITLESPRGPVTMWVNDASRYTPGGTVQVKTVIRAAE